jgi:hypothetical protein
MASKTAINQGLTALAIDNSIDISNQNLFDAKVNLTYADCKNLTDEQFTRAIHKIRSSGLELYGKLPKSAVILENAGIKEASMDTIASLEVARVLDYASYYFGNSVWFDNPTTNACVEVYGGIGKIVWAIDKTNDNKEDGKWVSKNLKEIWLQCYDGKKERNQPCLGRSKPKIFHKGELIDQPIKIDFVGDKTKYLAIEDKPKQSNIIQLPTLKKI